MAIFQSGTDGGLPELRPGQNPMSSVMFQAASIGVHDGWELSDGKRSTVLLFRDDLGQLLMAMEEPRPPESWTDEALEAGKVAVRLGRRTALLAVLPG